MNFLAIVQRLWLEAGASGASPGPSTVVSQTGEYARLVTWANSAWKAIQNKNRDWDWMRASASFTTVASTSTYTLGTGAGTVGVSVATFGQWLPYTARAYLTATGTSDEQFLEYIPYEDWRDRYLMGASRSVNVRPMEFSISPAKAICIPPALAGYTVTLDYFTAPTDLAADADIPSLPAQYHEAIVWRALMLYGSFEGAVESYDRGKDEYKRIMAPLEAGRLPEVGFAGALA